MIEDGAETDLDLGHYERFYRREHFPGASKRHRRSGLQLGAQARAPRRLPGGTVQVIPPTSPDEIKNRILIVAETKQVDFVITGSVAPWATSLRVSLSFSRRSVSSTRISAGIPGHVHPPDHSPYIVHAGEMKTSPPSIRSTNCAASAFSRMP